MNDARRFPAIRLLAAALLVGTILTSCATLAFRDDPALGSAKGWVVFFPYDLDGLEIHRIAGGMEGALLPVTSQLLSPLAHACPPGRNEFIARHQSYEERISVPVTEGAITYVSFWRQVTKSVYHANSSTVWYNVCSSVGSHPLPADQDASAPRPYQAALDDADVGTRTASLRALSRLSPEMDPATVRQLTSIAREDPFVSVQNTARLLLKKKGYPVPAPTVLSWSFRTDVEMLTTEDTESFAALFVPNGYLLRGKVEGKFWWRTRSSLYYGNPVGRAGIGDHADLDIVMECTWQEGAPQSAFGLTIGADDGSFNAFCANQQGGAVVLSVADSALSPGPAPVPWTNEAAAAITPSPVTRFEITKRGYDYTLTVNGVQAGRFTDSRRLDVGRIGMFLSGRQSVVFHKMFVTFP